MRLIRTIFLLLLLLSGCQKDEVILEGSIRGIISSYDQDLSRSTDQSGVKVLLHKDSGLVDSTYTDEHGYYIFEQIPYGKYDILLQKQKFVQARISHTVYHIGGYSPTRASYDLYEVPTFSINLDSVKYVANAGELNVYMKISGDTLPHVKNIYYYTFRIFFSNSPEVNRDNYTCQGKGYLYSVISESQSGLIVLGRIYIYEINNDFDQLTSDTIYMRIYPLAQGQGYWIEDYFREAMGKPSNVFAYLWNE